MDAPPATGQKSSRRRCRGCGSAAPRPAPLLSPDLVIAARDRNREPELPAETVERALAGGLPSSFARYDLLIAPPSAETVGEARALAVEFARHEHRVFWLDNGDPTTSFVGPRAPSLHVVAHSDAAHGDLFETLRSLRREWSIETGAVIADAAGAASLAAKVRADFGWRAAALHAAADGKPPVVAVPAVGGAEVRVALEAGLSWPERWGAVDRALRSAWPRASAIVVTIDNLAFTKLCLASLLANTDYPNLELIVVDNGSTDGTPEFLAELAGRHPAVLPIYNAENRGFGGANNQALAAASGDILVLLNNDTMVAPGWLSRLALRLADSRVGLAGPATNRTCNEAQVAAGYQTYGEFLDFAKQLAERHEGEARPIRMLAMFCAAFRRDLYERIGPLDERYGIGMFEDEDYALAAKAAGFEVAWCPEVYVHHAYHASIGKLLPAGAYLPLFRGNQRKFEHKWGICWERHRPPA